ncbi:hypothetical protein [Flavobacterium solisilvae]|uniref:Uncharacterized protein n=1 Tax=Flavobacterium solisilvae TaxID=1852019 RepID=A0ABX1QYA4_9FLAO|nr:hypothetical protein [Flavobacterium solisilvae]NMH26138.1 hypothetical protein [Flavobacterium solisilvae]
MENNIFFFGIIAVVLIVLIIFLVRQNQKDKEKLEEYLNNENSFIDKEDNELNDD